MISLDKAKRLKGLGLKWEPKEGDFYRLVTAHGVICSENEVYKDGCSCQPDDLDIWLPSLSQLLAETEARGYWYSLDSPGNATEGYSLLFGGQGEGVFRQHRAETPEDAAADAMIWILEQEKATKCKGCVCDDCDGTAENSQCPDTGCLYCPGSKDCEAKQ